jgi:hypothetical protein
LPNSNQQEHGIHQLQDLAQLTPQLARQWAEELCAAWDAIQPMEKPWRDLLASRQTTAEALKNLNELAQPVFAETEGQRVALERIRLLLDALALNVPSDSDVRH